MVCSVSIGTNDLAGSRDGSNGTGARRTIEHEQNTARIPRRRPLCRSRAADVLVREEPEDEEDEEDDGNEEDDEDKEDDEGYSE